MHDMIMDHDNLQKLGSPRWAADAGQRSTISSLVGWRLCYASIVSGHTMAVAPDSVFCIAPLLANVAILSALLAALVGGRPVAYRTK